MSTATTSAPARSASDATVRSWKNPIILSVVALFALLVFAIGAPGNDVTFRLSEENDPIVLPSIVVSAPVIGWVAALAMIVLAVLAILRTRSGRKIPV